MTGSVLTKNVIAVMDASKRELLEGICGWVLSIGGKDVWNGKIYPLDNQHPTIKVIEFKTTEEAYRSMQFVIEDLYPGLCVFNPPM